MLIKRRNLKMYRDILSHKLKELTAHESVNKIAKEIGIPQATLSRYINNEREANIEYLCLIANYFKVSPNYLLGYENEDYTKNYDDQNESKLISIHEGKLFKTFKSLDPHSQELITAYANGIFDRINLKKKNQGDK